MHEKMIEWMLDPNCRNHHKINGDGQRIHNNLFYTGKLSYAVAVPNFQGIVNTVGVQEGAMIYNKQHASNFEMQKNEYQGAGEENGQ